MHKLTTTLVRQASLVGIEDLNVAGMLKNHTLAQAIADGAWAELRRQLEYKTPAFGSRVIVIGRFVASSKTCNHCGHVHDALDLSMRAWECSNPICGLPLDRDLNAARNIRDEALRLVSA
nr:transposase [Oscillochloris trichoides]